MPEIQSEAAEYLGRAVALMEDSNERTFRPSAVRMDLSWCDDAHRGALDYLIERELAMPPAQSGQVSLTEDGWAIGEQWLNVQGSL